MKIKGSIEFIIVECNEDRVVAEMPIGPWVRNPFGIVNAGAIIWFADVTASVLIMGPQEAAAGIKGFPLAISLNANFLANQKEGSFRAVAAFVKRGRTVSVVRTTVYGAADKVIADVTSSHVLSK